MIASRAEPCSAEERRSCRDRHAGGVRARRPSHRAATDIDLRGLRIVRNPRAGRVRRPAASPLRRVSRTGVRRRHVHHARDSLLAERVARRGGNVRRRFRHALRWRDQRLLRGGRNRRAPDVCLAGDAPRAELRDPGPPRGMGARGRRGNLRGHAPLAAPCPRPPSAGSRRHATRRRGASRCEPGTGARTRTPRT